MSSDQGDEGAYMTRDEREQARSNFNSEIGFFGVRLDQEAPIVICDCVAYLRHKGYYQVGVFRVPGNQEVVNKLKKEYNERFKSKHLKEYSGYSVLNETKPPPTVNDVASLLKLFLTDLPQPIIPEQVTRTLFDIDGRNYGVTEATKFYSKVLNKLKSPHREVLSFLLTFLKELIGYQTYNNMTTQNIATCFVLPVFGSFISTQMNLIGRGGRLLQQLLTYDLTLIMPRKTSVQNNTRYFGAKRGTTKTFVEDPEVEEEEDLRETDSSEPLAPPPPAQKAPPVPEMKRSKRRRHKKRVKKKENEIYGHKADDLFGGLGKSSNKGKTI